MNMETKKQMRRGYFADQYFNNTATILTALANEGYEFPVDTQSDLPVDAAGMDIGNLEVEMQFFTRRQPYAVVAGMNEALEILQECVGYYDEKNDRGFVNTFEHLDVEAVDDGTIVWYDGNVANVKPVLKVRGRYRDFGHLETALLGVLAHGSRIATNTYEVLDAANGKRVLFFPARFDHYAVQEAAGYAYNVAIEAFKRDRKAKRLPAPEAAVSTPAQAAWFGGKAGGTTSHSTIAAFLGNPAEMMVQFARIMPVEVPRVALVDFHNDCVADTLQVLDAMFAKHVELVKQGDFNEAKKYKLTGVRPDTGGNMVDASIDTDGFEEPYGVTPQLVKNIKNAIRDYAGTLEEKYGMNANQYCKEVQVTVTGGFDAERIRRFEKANVPVDAYGVGSSLIENSKNTNTDFTADIVRVNANGEWLDLAKVGRKACDNPDLQPVMNIKLVPVLV